MKEYVASNLEVTLRADKPVQFKNLDFEGQVTVHTGDVDLFLRSFKNCSFQRLTLQGLEEAPLVLKANHLKNIYVRYLVLKSVQAIDENFLKGKTLIDLTIHMLDKNPVPLPKKLFKTTTLRSLYIYGVSKKATELIPISDGFLNGVKNIHSICITNAKFEKEFMTKANAGNVSLNCCALNTNMFKHTTIDYLYIEGKVLSKMFNTVKITGTLSAEGLTSIDKNFLKETFKENNNLTLYLGTWKSLKDFKELDNKTLNYLTFRKLVNASEECLVGTNVEVLHVNRFNNEKDPERAKKTFTKTNFRSFSCFDLYSPELDIKVNGYDNGSTVYLDHFYTSYISKKTINNITYYKIDPKRQPYLKYAVTTVESATRYSSHGVTLEAAMRELINKTTFRAFPERLLTKYKIDQVFTKDEAVAMYREVTGACTAGANYFLQTGAYPTKDKYTFAEIVAYTKGQYGNDRLLHFIKTLDTFEPDVIRARVEAYENTLKEVQQWQD